MIEKLPVHYSMTSPATVYDEEAMTALELAGRTAAKVNECVDIVNEADEHMRKNIVETTEKVIDELAKDGTLETNLVKAVSSGKVDKGANESISMKMLAADVKAAITGGSIPTVGAGSVNTSSIVDDAVTEAKISPALRNVVLFSTDMNKPLIILNGGTKTGVVNTEFTDTLELYCVDRYYSVNPVDLSLDLTAWDGTYYIKMYYNPSTKVIHVTPFNTPSTNFSGCLHLGRLGWHITDNVIPVQINDRFFCCKTQTRLVDAPKGLKPVQIALDRYRHPDNAVFNVDTANNAITVTKGGSYNIYVMNETFVVDFSNNKLDYSAVDFSKPLFYMYFDTVTSKLMFIQSAHDVNRNWVYMGVFYLTYPYMSTAIVPFTVNNSLYYHPNRNRREWARVIYSPYSWNTKCVPYVDFVNKKLVFPATNRLYLNTNEMNMAIVTNGNGVDYEVPFEETGNSYQYLVGSSSGLKFVNPTQFADLMGGCRKDELFYLGYCISTGNVVDFTFECVKGRTLSILGDSISTFGGYIPSGNTAYYNASATADVNMMWWKRAANRCGLALNKNNSNSGSRVTNTRSDGVMYGVEMVKNLDNGVAPDNIVIYMGINDYFNNVPIGTYDGMDDLPTSEFTFREAYAKMLYNALTTYPTSKVYACTLPTIERTSDDLISPDKNQAGIYLSEYNNAIREIAKAFCVEVIDLESCRINHYNGVNYMYDYDSDLGTFVHPNSEGHRMISHKVIKSLLFNEE